MSDQHAHVLAGIMMFLHVCRGRRMRLSAFLPALGVLRLAQLVLRAAEEYSILECAAREAAAAKSWTLWWDS